MDGPGGVRKSPWKKIYIEEMGITMVLFNLTYAIELRVSLVDLEHVLFPLEKYL